MCINKVLKVGKNYLYFVYGLIGNWFHDGSYLTENWCHEGTGSDFYYRRDWSILSETIRNFVMLLCFEICVKLKGAARCNTANSTSATSTRPTSQETFQDLHVYGLFIH